VGASASVKEGRKLQPKTLKLIVVTCVLLCLCVGAARASPVFGIHGLREWSAALQGDPSAPGVIRPVEADDFRLLVREDDAWPPEYQQAKFFTPNLYVEEHMDSHEHMEPALVMQWGDQGATGQAPPLDGERVAAAWDFIYNEDPPFDQTNMLEFSIHAPWPCMFVSVNMFDGQGNYREWIWHVGDPDRNPDDEGKIPYCTWTTVQVNPVTLWSNYKYETVFTHGLGFDLSTIQYIRFNENGVWSQEFQDPNTGLVWNAWNHVEVQPEPGTMLLLGSGLLALVARRRRKR
jgi:hypothetical protein